MNIWEAEDNSLYIHKTKRCPLKDSSLLLVIIIREPLQLRQRLFIIPESDIINNSLILIREPLGNHGRLFGFRQYSL